MATGSGRCFVNEIRDVYVMWLKSSRIFSVIEKKEQAKRWEMREKKHLAFFANALTFFMTLLILLSPFVAVANADVAVAAAAKYNY